MVSKFKGLMTLKEILARGQFWETIPVLEAISASEVIQSEELPVYHVFFLDFLFTLLLYSYFFN